MTRPAAVLAGLALVLAAAGTPLAVLAQQGRAQPAPTQPPPLSTLGPAPPGPPLDHVTVRDRLMCRTQGELRDGLRALQTNDRILFSTLNGCVFSIDGVPAGVIQDNISQVKIRLSLEGERADMWTVPEAIRRPPRENR